MIWFLDNVETNANEAEWGTVLSFCIISRHKNGMDWKELNFDQFLHFIQSQSSITTENWYSAFAIPFCVRQKNSSHVQNKTGVFVYCNRVNIDHVAKRKCKINSESELLISIIDNYILLTSVLLMRIRYKWPKSYWILQKLTQICISLTNEYWINNLYIIGKTRSR